MAFDIILMNRADEEERWTLTHDEMTIGRSDKCTIPIQGNTVSRTHVRLWLEQSIIGAEDLGSRNGIKINGIRTRSGSLQAGDSMEVGKHLFQIVVQGDEVSDKPPASEPLKSQPSNTNTFQKQMLHNPDARLQAALYQAARLQPYLFDQEKLFQGSLNLIMQAVPAIRGFLLIQKPGSSQPELAAKISRNNGDGPTLNPAIIENVFKKKNAVIVGDVSDEGVEHDSSKPGLIAIPLQIEKKCIGLLYLDSGWDATRFVTSNFEDAKSYAQAFAPVIENALKIHANIAASEQMGMEKAAKAIGKTLFDWPHQIESLGNGTDAGEVDAFVQKIHGFSQDLVGYGSPKLMDRKSSVINPCIQKALEELNSSIQKKNIVVDTRFDPRATAFFDRHLATRAIKTVLNLSVTECPDSGACIIVTSENKTEGCYLTIKDNGRPNDDAESILNSSKFDTCLEYDAEEFSLSSASLTMKRHGGKLNMKCDEGGNSFTFIFLREEQARNN
jgi:pSer/pThr/pTyr-binding forkhead associated (FHA) protein